MKGGWKGRRRITAGVWFLETVGAQSKEAIIFRANSKSLPIKVC